MAHPHRAHGTLLAAALLAGTSACGGPAEGTHPGHPGHPEFKSPEEWAQRFDDPARDDWQKPESVIRHLVLSSDSKVADIGAGTGYFTVRLASQVPVGRVYAVDVEASMVDYTVKRATALGLTNVEGVVAAPDDAKLPVPVDVMLIVDTYHHIDGRVEYMRRLHTKLAPGGRLAIVDYKVDPEVNGPPMEMRLSADTVIGEMTDAGWKLSTRSEGALPRQYILLFQ